MIVVDKCPSKCFVQRGDERDVERIQQEQEPHYPELWCPHGNSLRQKPRQPTVAVSSDADL